MPRFVIASILITSGLARAGDLPDCPKLNPNDPFEQSFRVTRGAFAGLCAEMSGLRTAVPLTGDAALAYSSNPANVVVANVVEDFEKKTHDVAAFDPSKITSIDFITETTLTHPEGYHGFLKLSFDQDAPVELTRQGEGAAAARMQTNAIAISVEGIDFAPHTKKTRLEKRVPPFQDNNAPLGFGLVTYSGMEKSELSKRRFFTYRLELDAAQKKCVVTTFLKQAQDLSLHPRMYSLLHDNCTTALTRILDICVPPAKRNGMITRIKESIPSLAPGSLYKKHLISEDSYRHPYVQSAPGADPIVGTSVVGHVASGQDH